jgi:sec-independent protein translocase protein TatA
MFGLGISEIVIVAIVAMILLFGSKKVVEIARSLGRVGGEFKKGQREIEAELKSLDDQSSSVASDTKEAATGGNKETTT